VQRVSGGDAVVNVLVSSSTACAGTPCAITPGTTLTLGTPYRWRVRTKNASGDGPWSAFMTFTPAGLPAAPVPNAPNANTTTLTPAYSWTKVASATSYQIAVQRTSGGAAATADYDASVCSGATCSARPSIALLAGTQYRWKVRARNGAGYGPWSIYRIFTPAAGLPGVATLISPTGPQPNLFPTYRWNKVAAATRYYLTVRNASGTVLSQNYLSASICGSTTCQVTPSTPLAAGSFTWRIQTHNASGYGGLSAAMPFSTTSTTMSMVLTWGANPADLDSHLLTPSGHHIYYASRGSATSTPFATLDVDDVTGFGPETIFVHQAQSGTYRYFVRRYSGAGTIAGSGAQVKLYKGTTLLGTFTAPSTGSGDYWHVCTITNAATAARTCPNSISSTPPAGAPGSASSEADAKKTKAGSAFDDDGGRGGDEPPAPRTPPARTPRPREGGPPKR
jgi:hypothetical protein